MSDNQYVFEVIRDVGYLIQDIEENDTLWLNVTRDSETFFSANSSKGMPYGLSETSRAIEKAYKVTRCHPDVRDEKIKTLSKEYDEAIDLLMEITHELESWNLTEGDPQSLKIIAKCNKAIIHAKTKET